MAVLTFLRHEYKYKLNEEQFKKTLIFVKENLAPDKYKEYDIASLYYDTPNFRMIRRSIEKPKYKEKIRIRSYGVANDKSIVFLELKKKNNGVVFKRRIATQMDVINKILNDEEIENPSQIEKEIKYALKFYGKIEPKYLLIYHRLAYHDPNSELRLTFDYNIRYRADNLNVTTTLEGKEILPNEYIMEIKAGEALPLWLVKYLSENHIYKTSFSKVGTAYKLEHMEGKENG